MLPFVLSSCLALLFSSLSGGFKGEAPVMASPLLISPAEYRTHAEYQQRFSLLPLGRNGFDEASYFHYDVDEDGLISKAGLLGEDLSAIPPFPLETLMDFLGESDSVAGMRNMGVSEFVPVLMVLLLCIPALSGRRGKGKKKGTAIYNDKRIAA
jgi:hypothetical protein